MAEYKGKICLDDNFIKIGKQPNRENIYDVFIGENSYTVGIETARWAARANRDDFYAEFKQRCQDILKTLNDADVPFERLHSIFSRLELANIVEFACSREPV